MPLLVPGGQYILMLDFAVFTVGRMPGFHCHRGMLWGRETGEERSDETSHQAVSSEPTDFSSEAPCRVQTLNVTASPRHHLT
jgi:hypothetical protein